VVKSRVYPTVHFHEAGGPSGGPSASPSGWDR
jgi:hypothetical protein